MISMQWRRKAMNTLQTNNKEEIGSTDITSIIKIKKYNELSKKTINAR